MPRRLSAAAAACLVACAPSEPPPAPEQPAARAPLFEEVSATTGLAHTHDSGATGAFLFAEILGSGVALLDYDLDGDLDVYLVQSGPLDPAPEGAALFPPPPDQPPGNRLFRNALVETGTLGFVDVTEAAGVGARAYGMGAAVGDIDNDGDPDLYVTNFGDNVLYRNNGDGTFTDVTEAANANAPNWSMSASFFDLENDGDLDLYVTAYVEYALAQDQECSSASGNRDYCGPQNYRYARDYLLRNDGSGRFEDIGEAMGVSDARGPGLGVTAADFDGDGRADLFVANDGEANFAWMNRGAAGFEELGLMSGTAYNRDGTPEASMGVSAGDFDADGDEDLFMTHLINETNTLYLNDGTGHFDDATDRFGLGAGSKPYTGFGTAWFDYDNDGWPDLYIANGDVKVEELRASDSDYPFDQPNQLFRNLGGARFEEIGAPAGAATGLSEISRGVAFGDLDNDGRTDFVVTNNSGPVRVFLNRAAADNDWVGLTLRGTASNRDAVGARVRVARPGQRPLWRRVHTDGSYLSANDPRLSVGLGPDVAQVAVTVSWPSGRVETWADLATGERHVLVEGQGRAQPPAGQDASP